MTSESRISMADSKPSSEDGSEIYTYKYGDDTTQKFRAELRESISHIQSNFSALDTDLSGGLTFDEIDLGDANTPNDLSILKKFETLSKVATEDHKSFDSSIDFDIPFLFSNSDKQSPENLSNTLFKDDIADSAGISMKDLSTADAILEQKELQAKIRDVTKDEKESSLPHTYSTMFGLATTVVGGLIASKFPVVGGILQISGATYSGLNFYDAGTKAFAMDSNQLGLEVADVRASLLGTPSLSEIQEEMRAARPF